MNYVVHRIEEPRSEYEQYLYRLLNEMRQRHELEMKPILDALCEIECLKTPRYYYVPSDMAGTPLDRT